MDTTDTARLVVRDELLALRKSPGVLSSSKLAAAYTTCFYLCGGDPEQALDLLHGYAKTFIDDREVQVALRSIGLLETDKHTSVLDRLNSIATDLFLEQRHVRRLSDTGVTRLAGLIVDSMLGANVWVDAYISEDNGAFLVQVRYKTPPNIDILSLHADICGSPVAEFETVEGDNYLTSTSKVWRVEPPDEQQFTIVTLTVRATAQAFFTASSIASDRWRTRAITSRMTMTIDLLRRQVHREKLSD